MILRTCDIKEFVQRNKNKQVVCYGAGNWLNILSEEFHFGIETVYAYAVDSNPKLWGTKKKVVNTLVEVRPPQYLYDNVTPDTVILITSGEYYAEIYTMLEARAELTRTECYWVSMLKSCELDRIAYGAHPVPNEFRMNPQPVIPKIIHYTWFSGEPLPESAKRCMETWKKYAPDYEIVQWNAENYDLTAHPYVNSAINNRKWGFAGDYVRLDVVYRYGGFYFDLDVELLRSIDELRYQSAFCGFETAETINLGSGFGAALGHPVIKALRDHYDSVDFVKKDGSLDLTASPYYQTRAFTELGANINSEFQIVQDCAIYPAIYFAPKSLLTGRMCHSPLSYSVHHFDGSWLTKADWQARSVKLDMKAKAIQNEKASP